MTGALGWRRMKSAISGTVKATRPRAGDQMSPLRMQESRCGAIDCGFDPRDSARVAVRGVSVPLRAMATR